MRLLHNGLAVSLVVAVALFGAACGNSGDDNNNDGDGGVDDGDGDVFDPDAQRDAPPTPPGMCPTGVTQCTDGVDNDNDQMTDADDAECTGACDNDEGSFATGTPGDNRDPFWQDCFFDGNSGAGNDGCRYNTCCLYPAGSPMACTQQQINSGACDVSQECVNVCAPAAPPGCDCFGCCTVCGVTGGCGDANGCVKIVLLPTCQFENICTDQINCPLCQQDDECATQCPSGAAECTMDSECAANEACADGCCVAVIP